MIKNFKFTFRLETRSKRAISNLKKGFTLVELILYMALVSIFILTLTDIFSAILNVKTESEATSAVEQDGRFILARLSHDVSQAGSITTPVALGDSSSTLVATIDSTTHTYNLDNGKLQLTNGLGTNDLNGSENTITNITFQKIGNSGGKETIKIEFTIESKAQRPSGPEVKTFKTTVGRR